MNLECSASECREKTQMNQENLKAFIRANIYSFAFLGIMLWVAYGMKLSHLSISHDTEAIISVPDSLYDSWVSMGRYGLLLLKKIFGLYQFNPWLASVLMFLAMMSGAVIWEYLFYQLANTKKGFGKISWIFPAFFLTAPMMAEQLSFELQAFEVSLAILITGVVLLLIWQGFIRRRYWYAVPAVLLLALSFSCYQTIIPLYMAAAAACFLIYYKRQERFWSSIFWMIGIMGVSFVIYELGSKVALQIFQITPTNYLSDQILWGNTSVVQCVRNILYHIRDALFCRDIYYSMAYPIAVIFAIVLLVMMFRRKQKNFYLYLLGLLFLLLTPFIMTILLGQQPKFRTQIVLPFVFGFLFQNFALELIEIGKNGGKVLLRGITAISVILIFQQINITSKMFYSEYVQYEEDVRLAVKITDRIDQLNLGENPEEPVVIIGSRSPRLNPSAYGGYENPGNSFYEWCFKVEYGTFIIQNFWTTLGYDYHMPNAEQSSFAERYAEKMPSWPDTGSVRCEEGVIIVKLS